MLIGIDYMNRKDLATLKCFKASGVQVLLRYYYPTEPKSLGPDELADISKIGFSVIPVWETTGGQGWGESYFTRTQGVQDATGALARATLLNQPKDTHIYFAVDTGVLDPSRITEYWNGVYDTLRPNGYKVGCYAFWNVIQYGQQHWPGVTAYWQTYGADPGTDVIWQDEQTTLCGVVVDMNRVPERLAEWKVNWMDQEEFNRMALVWWQSVNGPSTLDAMKAVDANLASLKADKTHTHDTGPAK